MPSVVVSIVWDCAHNKYIRPSAATGGHIFRAVCLTLMAVTVLPCSASETSETTRIEADITTAIPKAALEGDLQQVFRLRPSATLRIVDETCAAV
ncbi:UNVERIFIED_CONTAM: toxoplasma gondii family A protein [Hammondia hammondi]|eukprot:XP_008887108.1 toxoplasma gondii family A protein [Hammondia hammondi]